MSFPFITSAKLFLSRSVRTSLDFLPCSGIEKARPLFTVELCFHALYERVLLRRLLIFTFLKALPFRRKGKRKFESLLSISLKICFFTFYHILANFLPYTVKSPSSFSATQPIGSAVQREKFLNCGVFTIGA